MLPAKMKLNTIEVLFSKSLIDSYISHDEFFSANDVLREYNQMKEEAKSSETSTKYIYKYKYGWYKQKNVWKKYRRNNSR